MQSEIWVQLHYFSNNGSTAGGLYSKKLNKLVRNVSENYLRESPLAQQVPVLA